MTDYYNEYYPDEVHMSPFSSSSDIFTLPLFFISFIFSEMGTHSHVGIRRCNGKIHYIYIHSDGYPSGAGATLVCKYNTLARVEKLIAAGSQVCVDEDPVQNDDESFATADDDEAYRNTGRWIEY